MLTILESTIARDYEEGKTIPFLACSLGMKKSRYFLFICARPPRERSFGSSSQRLEKKPHRTMVDVGTVRFEQYST